MFFRFSRDARNVDARAEGLECQRAESTDRRCYPSARYTRCEGGRKMHEAADEVDAMKKRASSITPLTFNYDDYDSDNDHNDEKSHLAPVDAPAIKSTWHVVNNCGSGTLHLP